MFDKLFSWFVQEIPEELSVCEFECCRAECTMGDWTVCRLRSRIRMRDSDIIRHTAFEIEVGAVV